jgi:outer membrane protein OmpA-like peptidoglycan-associated protein
MTQRALQLLSAGTMVVGVVLLTTACSTLLRGATTGSVTTESERQPSAIQRIAQLYYGRDATYAVCIEPACPTVTPKTVATRALPAQVIPPTRSEPVTETLDDGEEEIDTPEPLKEQITLRFKTGTAALDRDAKRMLDEMMPVARRATKITISGRTDNVGPSKVNEAIALSRALQVREYIRAQMREVNNVIEIDARGSCCFITKNDTAAGRQQNRRVEVLFTLDGEVRRS